MLLDVFKLNRKKPFAVWGIVAVVLTLVIFLGFQQAVDRQRGVPSNDQVQQEIDSVEGRSPRVKSESGQKINDYNRVRESLTSSKDPEKFLLSILADLNRLDGIDRDLALSEFVGGLTNFSNPQDGLFWLQDNRRALYGALSGFDVGQGRSLYDEVLTRVEDLCSNEGIDFITAIKSQANRDLAIDVLPFELKASGAWDSQLLNSLDPKQRQTIEARTVRQLALANFSNNKALSMLLDEQCSLDSDPKLVNQVIQRDYFWDHTSEILGVIESSKDSKKKDDALVRSAQLMAERDKTVAQKWAGWIADSAKREKLIKEITGE